MSKPLKIAIIFTLFFSVYTYTNADTTNLYNDVENETSNTTSYTSSDNTSENPTIDDETDELENNVDLSEETSSYARSSTPNANAAGINTLSSISEANLGLNNILCILLIAIGILIVLLAIAILIRLKNK